MRIVKSGTITAIVLCATVLLLGGGIPARAQQTSGQFFPQTGHNVVGEFWTFYQSVPDAALVFGLPISEQFISADGSGLIVQYFERARFELHADQPVGLRVQPTALGSRLYRPGLPSLDLAAAGSCRVIDGFGVCYDFLAFFDAHGGISRFGDPISAFEFQPDGRILQYFERARFEWHPELPAGQKVRLADLGSQYFGAVEDPARLNPLPPGSNIPVRISVPDGLHARVFVARAVAAPAGEQRIFVVVQDQAYGPVEGATGTVTVRFPAGQALVYPITTNAAGLAVIPAIVFSGQPPGRLVVLDVEMVYQGLRAVTRTSFRIWH
jgi:hypothetical protein